MNLLMENTYSLKSKLKDQQTLTPLDSFIFIKNTFILWKVSCLFIVFITQAPHLPGIFGYNDVKRIFENMN